MEAKDERLNQIVIREAEIVDEINRLTDSLNATDIHSDKSKYDSISKRIDQLEQEREKLHEGVQETFNLKNFTQLTDEKKVRELLPLYIYDMRNQLKTDGEITTLNEMDVEDIVGDEMLHPSLRPNVLFDESADTLAIVYPRRQCTLVSIRRIEMKS